MPCVSRKAIADKSTVYSVKYLCTLTRKRQRAMNAPGRVNAQPSTLLSIHISVGQFMAQIFMMFNLVTFLILLLFTSEVQPLLRIEEQLLLSSSAT